MGTPDSPGPPPPFSPHQAGTWAVLGFLMGTARSLHMLGVWVTFTLTTTSTSHLPPVTEASAFSK